MRAGGGVDNHLGLQDASEGTRGGGYQGAPSWERVQGQEALDRERWAGGPHPGAQVALEGPGCCPTVVPIPPLCFQDGAVSQPARPPSLGRLQQELPGPQRGGPGRGSRPQGP